MYTFSVPGEPLPLNMPLLAVQGKYAEAELLYELETEIREKALGPDHPIVAAILSNRAGLLKSHVRAEEIIDGPHSNALDKYAEAEPFFERSQVIREMVLCPDHLAVSQLLNNREWLLNMCSSEISF